MQRNSRQMIVMLTVAFVLAVGLRAAAFVCEEGKSELSGNCVTCDQGYAEMMDEADSDYEACPTNYMGSCYTQWVLDAAAAVAWLTWCEGTIYS